MTLNVVHISNTFDIFVVVVFSDWSCEEEASDNEEVCTCRSYEDNETTRSDDDELPSKDVDLSSYSIASELRSNANDSSTETPTSRQYRHRKRKITERSPTSSPDHA